MGGGGGSRTATKRGASEDCNGRGRTLHHGRGGKWREADAAADDVVYDVIWGWDRVQMTWRRRAMWSWLQRLLSVLGM